MNSKIFQTLILAIAVFLYDIDSVKAQLSGSYTIDNTIAASSSNYTSFSAAANDLSTLGVSSSVTFTVNPNSGPYIEQVQIDTIVGADSVNNVTFFGNGAILAFNCSDTNRAIFRLNGASYVTIDSLNIVSQNNLYGWGIHLMNGANHNHIRKCNINLSSVTDDGHNNALGIVSSNSMLVARFSGDNASYCIFEDNHIDGGTDEGMYYGIVLAGSSTSGISGMGHQILNNTITNIARIGISLTYIDSSVVLGNDISRGNKVRFFGSFTGIAVSNGSRNVQVLKNRVHNSHGAAIGNSGAASGIQVSADAPAGKENIIANNLIYDLNSRTNALYGITNLGAEGAKYYHNTVVIDEQSSTGGITRGMLVNSASLNLDIKNNIFYITRSGSGDVHGLYIDPISSSPGITCDNNVVYLNPTGTGSSDYGYWINSDISTLTSWRTLVSFGVNSTDVDPQFVDIEANNFTPFSSAVDSLGAAIATVPTDFFDSLRDANHPDPGAIEFKISSLDLGILNPSFIDAKCPGIDSIYLWVRNFGFDDVDSLKIGMSANGVVRTAKNYNVSLTRGDSVQLFVDTVTLNSSQTYDIKVWTEGPNGSADLQPVNDTLTLRFQLGMVGTYTIGSSGDYDSFTAAVNDLKDRGVCGPVVFNVDASSGPYIEKLNIPEIRGASVINSITFNGNGAVLSDSTDFGSQSLIQFYGADYITFDSLELVSTSANYCYGFHLTNDARYNTIRNCRVDLSSITAGSSTAATGILCNVINNQASSNGSAASYNKFIKNTITGGTAGLYYTVRLNGAADGTGCVGNEFIENTIQDFFQYGIYMRFADSTQIVGNDISRPNKVTGSSFHGVYIFGDCKNNYIANNRIHDANNSMANNFFTYGVRFNDTDAPPGEENVVANNLFYGFTNNTTSLYALYNYSSDGAHYYNNTISLDDTASVSGFTAAFYQTQTATNVEFKNNLVSITRGGSDSKYGAFLATAASSLSIDYNNYYLNSTGTGSQYIGRYNGNTYPTLAAWKAAVTYDGNSLDVSPEFLSLPDSLQPTSVFLNNKGTVLGAVNKDILGVTRSSTTPDIGAYEFTPFRNDAGIAQINGLVAPCPGTVEVTLQNYSTFRLDSVIISWSINGNVQPNINYTTPIDSGLSVNVSLGSISVVSATTYDIKVWTSMPNGKVDGFTNNDTAEVFGWKSPLNGNYTIGNTGDYLTVVDAVNDLNSRGICSAVVFDIDPSSGPYRGRFSIGEVRGVNAIDTVLFKGNNSIITDTATFTTRHVVLLDGADYITFDSVDIVCTGKNYGFGVVLTNNAQYNNLKNSTVDMTPVTSAGEGRSAAIVISGEADAIGVEGNNASNNNFVNNLLKGGTVGVYDGVHIIGDSSLSGCSNNRFIGNTIQNFHSRFVWMKFSNGTVLSKNDITRSGKTTIGVFYGIYLSGSNKNVLIEKNLVHGTHNNSPTALLTYGIYFAGANAPGGEENFVQNNILYDFNGTGTAYGIYNAASNGAHYLHNTISFDSQNSGVNGATYGGYFTTAVSNVEFKNNMVTITRGGSGDKYGLYITNGSANVNSDYNNIYLNSSGSGSQFVGRWTSLSYLTLATWQGANLNAFDQNSVSANPQYVNPALADFTPTNNAINGTGIGLANVVDDIFDNSRDPVMPDPGAIEFADNTDIALKRIVDPASGCDLDTNEVIRLKVLNLGNVSIQPLILNYTVNGGPISTDTILNALAPGDSITHDFVQKYDMKPIGLYSIKAFVTLPGDVDASNDTLTRVVEQRKNPSFSLGNDTATCFGDSITLSAPSGFSAYDWGVSSAQSIQVKNTGSYNVKITDGFGCEARDTIFVQFNSLPIVALTADTSLCEDDQILLNAGTGVGNIYGWNTLDSTSTLLVDGNVVGVGTYFYKVEVTNINGCKSSDSVNVTFGAQPTIDLGVDTSACQGDSIQLNGPAGFVSYDWGFSSSQVINATTSGKYVLLVEDAVGCEASDSINVVFNALPSVVLPNDTTLCDNITLVLDAGNSPGYKYRWNTNDTISNIVVDGKELSPGVHRFEVEVTNQFGCKAEDAINLTLIAAPDQKLIDGDTICNRDSVRLDAGAGISLSYLWSNSDTTQIATFYGSNLVDGVNEIIVRVTAPNGCITFDTTEVLVKNCVGIEEQSFRNSIRIFPNPARELLTVDVNGLQANEQVSVQLLDMSGRILRSSLLIVDQNRQEKIDLSQYARGVYFVKVSSLEHSFVEKIIFR